MMTSEKIPSILVVDDEALLLTIVAETLRDAGYTVFEAFNGNTAIAMLKQHSDIGVLISDIKMPDISGYQVVDFGLSHRSDLKVILMTGYAQDPMPRQIAEAGVQVLLKPFDFALLPKLVDRVLTPAKRNH